MSATRIGDIVQFALNPGLTITGTVVAKDWHSLTVVTTPAAGEVPPGLDHLTTTAPSRTRIAEQAADAALAFVEAFRTSGLDPVSITALVDAANAWEKAR
ncbi:hypothetical protein Xcel_0572 [Xylanimonas cellulosilytica DSM 15894]|uniref:Uncharacterized protein n=1 Tax=Xylanimonas cellulosilytica (strain DSM 15894 / JCM 12276 / CECT 5975 / KCTC 9989 / LMG 20990 / NBRC 107835 / XIL07) TaxID=446471 RepID=D1BWM9_XYLCX|nr:hypothetical protein [Xylanimonas cellulosilytica]ACZ29611.1 hypothetical protein Xcel_0572 [Xylanimonas cellulosilytica DSM 15894]